MKELSIKTLGDKISPQMIADEMGNKKGMGNFKDWDLWEIKYDRALCSRGPYYLARKDQLWIADDTFTSVLEYIDKDVQTSV